MAWVWMTQVAFTGMGVGVSLGLHGLTTFLSLSLSVTWGTQTCSCFFPLFRWFQPLFKDLTTTQLAAEVSICPRFYRPIQPLPCQEIISSMGLPVNRVPHTDWTIWSLLFNIVNANFIRIQVYDMFRVKKTPKKKTSSSIKFELVTYHHIIIYIPIKKLVASQSAGELPSNPSRTLPDAALKMLSLGPGRGSEDTE